MFQNMDLKELEKQIYLSYHRDGLLDFLFGLVILLFGIGMAVDTFLFIPLMVPLILGIWYFSRKFIITPRMGYVDFSIGRKRKETWKAIFLILPGVGILAIITAMIIKRETFSYFMEVLERYPLLIPALLFAIPPFIGGFMLNINRMFIYSILIILIFVPGQILFEYEPFRVIFTG